VSSTHIALTAVKPRQESIYARVAPLLQVLGHSISCSATAAMSG